MAYPIGGGTTDLFRASGRHSDTVARVTLTNERVSLETVANKGFSSLVQVSKCGNRCSTMGDGSLVHSPRQTRA